MLKGTRFGGFWGGLHSLVQISTPKPVQKRADHSGMDKLNARLLPAAVVVTGFLSVFGGYFGNR